ncbi:MULTISPECIES: globin [unclassified Planococcus (in: firmicutes)]|uniref:globin domain-containing protein n=1 Tax=unclassified Planococcus (in: firmicutes) TaxID=2662419 RepID=UPI000C32865F|nr:MULTISPECIES: globin [unclassified Planococcus (in: firmicutes)]AUD14262.1 globin [Planococcus sp. MB-3u-03]PKG48293.1 globin [Planococcus sp. Urea-trap-24]PKG92140.1 globin [Planococcus sp. Urea-3u-39]PKH42954.1 globin [Planococcus sp. MB-3u-09]
MTGKPLIPYDEIGAETLSNLVDAFYARVSAHPQLAPIFPDDLNETARKQKQFLTQYLGGPNIYSAEHGHPRLKARHHPFPITPDRAQAWLECMSEAMDEVGLSGQFRETFFNRLVLTAHHMVNDYDSEEELE